MVHHYSSANIVTPSVLRKLHRNGTDSTQEGFVKMLCVSSEKPKQVPQMGKVHGRSGSTFECSEGQGKGAV